MSKDTKTYAILLAGGVGKRMKSVVPKQYMDLLGHPVIAWSLMTFQKSLEVDGIVLVTAPDDRAWVKSSILEPLKLTKVMGLAPAGKERQDSVKNGLKMLQELTGDSESAVVMIHDGARPCVTQEIIARCKADALRYGACAAAMPVKDTIKVADENGFVKETPDRSTLWAMQTPQTFSMALLKEAYRAYDSAQAADAAGITDDAMLIERFTTVRVKLTRGAYENLKITTPEDLSQAELLVDKALFS